VSTVAEVRLWGSSIGAVSGTWTASHQMSLAGKRDGFTLEDLKAVAETASMKRGRAEAIAREVTKAVSRWREFADDAGVAAKQIDMIAAVHRIDLAPAKA
jgi:serine/threonine-protein kinase HipA